MKTYGECAHSLTSLRCDAGMVLMKEQLEASRKEMRMYDSKLSAYEDCNRSLPCV